MKNRSELDRKIQETLDSLNGLKRASAPDFFFTRLQAKLVYESRSIWDRAGSFITRPLVFATVLAAVVFTNFIVVFKEEVNIASQSSIEKQGPEEYNLALTSFYESEITEP